jgi:hypothetical protein
MVTNGSNIIRWDNDWDNNRDIESNVPVDNSSFMGLQWEQHRTK